MLIHEQLDFILCYFHSEFLALAIVGYWTNSSARLSILVKIPILWIGTLVNVMPFNFSVPVPVPSPGKLLPGLLYADSE